jgi:CHAD domain-containing protein
MIQTYAAGQGSKLLRRLAHRLNQAASSPDPDAVHDLRVAIRRFQQFLRVFRQFLPDRTAKKIRRRLRKIMKSAGEVRNRDIAAMLLSQTDRRSSLELSTTLARQRSQAEQDLVNLLNRLQESDFEQKWHAKLRF